MKITITIEEPRRTLFHLNVGGFTIKNCRWYPASWRILFPIRYDKYRHRHPVVFVHGWHLRPLRDLLQSGSTQTPRDRRPCNLRIHLRGRSRNEFPEWRVFNFTVRGFTILGCRWQPASGSIQLPVTFLPFDDHLRRHPKKRVVCAFGANIVRLREALEARWFDLTGARIDRETEVAVPV
jgi:hypothetical protein